MGIQKINIEKKLRTFSEVWTPKIVGELNGQWVKVAKFKGEFVRHAHVDEDELFWVISGQLHIHLDDETLILNPGEMVIIPRGVAHQPIAPTETHVVLFEPKTTRNTGDQTTDHTTESLDWI